MKIIGLTGGIGSGKSTVASVLRELGAVIIDSDKVGHEVLNPATPGWQEVTEAFGRDIISENGTIDRHQLAQIVFKNSEALRQLNQIVHPKIELEIQSRLKIFREQGIDIVVIEAALIDKAPWSSMADQIWVVKTSREITLQRLRDRGMGEFESLSRMACQNPPEKFIKHGLVIIDNDGSLEDLRAQVVKLWKDVHN